MMRDKKIVKLAVLRSNDGNICPFGLSVPSACNNVGRLISKMTPLDAVSDEEKEKVSLSNNKIYEMGNMGQKCPFAKRFFEKNPKIVDCSWNETNQDLPKSSMPAGSPFYARHFSGIGLDGLDVWPMGGYRDNSIDRGYYYGAYSIESTGSESANKTQYNRKLLSFRDLGMELTKKSQLDLSEFDDMPRTAINGQHGWSTDGFSLPINGEDENEDADLYVDEFDYDDLDDDYINDVMYVEDDEDEDKEGLLEGNLDGEVTIQIGEEEPVKKDFDFKLSLVPGGEYQDSLDDLAEFSVKEPEDTSEAAEDPWSYTVPTFLNWLQNKMVNVPKHSGKGSAGCERAISYLNALDGHISRVARQDINDVLDINAIEDARREIRQGIDRLEKRLEQIKSSLYSKKKNNKTASVNENGEIIKEAKTAKFTVVVPLFISSMARTCINSMVSAGKDIEDCYGTIVKKYDLSNREQAELFQLLADMGYAMRRPRGHLMNEEIDYTSSDNLDWASNYPA